MELKLELAKQCGASPQCRLNDFGRVLNVDMKFDGSATDAVRRKRPKVRIFIADHQNAVADAQFGMPDLAARWINKAKQLLRSKGAFVEFNAAAASRTAM